MGEVVNGKCEMTNAKSDTRFRVWHLTLDVGVSM
jgi:hypothetical protein